MAEPPRSHPTWNIAWTRGHGCQPVALALGHGAAHAVRAELVPTCIEQRTDLLVTRRLTSFDLVPLAVPHDVDLDQTTTVAVAVSDGPHSPLAVEVAARLSGALGLPWRILTGYREPEDRSVALGRLHRLARQHPDAEQEAIETPNASDLTDGLDPTTLLVLGAGGGSWLQRQFFGPGHRLSVAAPGGTVVVRSAPRRCFHALDADDGPAVGPHMPAGEARRLFDHAVIPVALSGRLVGIVRATVLDQAGPQVAVSEIMEPAVSVSATEPLSAARDLTEFLDGGPVPVTGSAGQLLGVINVSDDDPPELADV